MDYYIGLIQAFGFNFAPRGFMFCNGQLLSIPQYSALFALLGTTYGGNGSTTFALPDLRGRAGLHFGHGPGLQTYTLGQASGVETDTLIQTQLPAHTHPLIVTETSTATSPEGAFLGKAALASDGAAVTAYGTVLNTQMSPQAIGFAGGNQPHNNMEPYLVLNWCICVEGIFPSRN